MDGGTKYYGGPGGDGPRGDGSLRDLYYTDLAEYNRLVAAGVIKEHEAVFCTVAEITLDFMKILERNLKLAGIKGVSGR